MGRPKSYRVEEVVARALPAFWEAGYESTSLADLERVTGLNKFSLYDAFGSKRGLYLACLDHYVAAYLRPFFAAFDPAPDGSIEAFLKGVVEHLGSVPGWGCVLLNGGVEFRGQDADLNGRITATYEVLTARLEAHWHDRNRAEALTALVRGLMASGRLGLDSTALNAIVEGSRRLWAP